MKTLKNIIAAIAIMAAAIITGCKKDKTPSGYMAMEMTGMRISNNTPPQNPTITSVKVDITSVLVHYSNEKEGDSGWVALNTNAGVYDLLVLQNNVSAVLTKDTKLPVGEISQLRLILGPNNSIVISGDEHMLTVPSGDNTGLKINVNTSIGENEHWIIALDFDADKSVVIDGQGEFKLKPVIEVKSVTKY